MPKRIFSYIIIINILILTGCSSGLGNRGNSGKFGLWATNSSFLSKRKPSIWQCVLAEGKNGYQNKECN